MSRADRRLPPAPGIGASLRQALGDLYASGWRFVVGNVAVAASVFAVAALVVGSPFALLLVPLLVIPAAGLMRMATFQVREHHTVLSELWWPIRHRPARIMVLGTVQLVVDAVLLADLSIGIGIGNLLGAFLGASAAYGLAIVWTLALVAWPLLLDPGRDDERAADLLRLAGVLVLAHPVRHVLLAVLLGTIVVLATIAVPAILTFALAAVFLIAATDAIAVADRWQGREPDDEEE